MWSSSISVENERRRCLPRDNGFVANGKCTFGQVRLTRGEHEKIAKRFVRHQVFGVFAQENPVLDSDVETFALTMQNHLLGAHDGVNNSNMRNLVVNHGWSSFQIEGDPQRAAKLAANYADFPKVKTLQGWVWPGNIEILFEENGVPEDLDLLVIDIDSNDYYVWRAIHNFRPKVVIIEMNFVFPPPQLMVVDYHPMNYWDRTHYNGASIQSLYNLGKKKGYELVYQLSAGPNIVFVDKKYFDRFDIPNNSPSEIYVKYPDAFMNRIEHRWGRDGVPWPKGKEKLTWEKLEIEKKYIYDR